MTLNLSLNILNPPGGHSFCAGKLLLRFLRFSVHYTPPRIFSDFCQGGVMSKYSKNRNNPLFLACIRCPHRWIDFFCSNSKLRYGIWFLWSENLEVKILAPYPSPSPSYGAKRYFFCIFIENFHFHEFSTEFVQTCMDDAPYWGVLVGGLRKIFDNFF